MDRDEALKHFRVGMGKLIKYLERAGVLAKPKISAQIVSATTSEIKIQLTIPRHLIPDLIVLDDTDIVGDIAIDTSDLLTTSDVAAEDPTK